MQVPNKPLSNELPPPDIYHHLRPLVHGQHAFFLHLDCADGTMLMPVHARLVDPTPYCRQLSEMHHISLRTHMPMYSEGKRCRGRKSGRTDEHARVNNAYSFTVKNTY